MDSGGREDKRIVCIGTALIDCIVKGFDPNPINAAGFFASSAELSPGGEALNQSIAFAKLGKKVGIVCFIGEDYAGDIIDKRLKDFGVDDTHVRRISEAKTPVAVLFTDETGDRKSISTSAHRFNFHPENDMSFLDGASAVSLGSLFRAPFNEPDVVTKIVTEAKRRRLPVYADTKLLNFNKLSLEDFREALPLIDCIFPNEKEGRFYSGKEDPEDMADTFLGFGVGSVIVKLGGDGCLYKDAERTIRLSGLPVKAVDATGAGDNFAAGFITMRTEGNDIETSLRFANACGAVSTTCVGACDGLEDRQQIYKVMARYGS